VAHLYFFPTQSPMQKKIQKSHQANAQRHCKQWTIEQGQRKRQHLTAPTQKAGYRVPKKVLWLIKH
jgi:hypothetical protein